MIASLFRGSLAGAALLAALACPASAQQEPPYAHAIRSADPVGLLSTRAGQAPSAGALVLAGAAASAAGVIAGGFLGYRLDYDALHWGCERGCEDPGLRGMLAGAMVGSAILTPLTVHLVNGRRGSLPVAFLSAAALGSLGVLAAGADATEGVFLVLPIAQVVSAVLIERRAAVR